MTLHRSRPMQVTASRRHLREVRRIIKEEGEIKVCHVIIKCLICTVVLHVCHWSFDRVHIDCTVELTRHKKPCPEY